jgi:ketosteroid isomerase-like protein
MLRLNGTHRFSRVRPHSNSQSLDTHRMTDRQATERLLRDLYAARVKGDVAAVYDKFTPNARFQIAGASHSTPVAVRAAGESEYRPLLAIMIKTFKLSDEEIISMIIDGAKAAVHWRAKIFSRLTGTTVLTELVDMIEIRDGRIGSYVEFFAPH